MQHDGSIVVDGVSEMMIVLRVGFKLMKERK
jgi:hypothetical protein